jgi:hypothetical protein
VISWRAERIQDWVHEYQVSGWLGGCGASQQETPRMGEGEVVSVSLATWKMALFIPQRHRAASES